MRGAPNARDHMCTAARTARRQLATSDSPAAGGILKDMTRLTRSKDDRVIGGVAGGVARRLGISPTLVRLAWVVSVFFGGFGVLAYVILWVVVPEDTPRSSATRIAEERFARGEITAAELEQVRSALGVAR